MLLPQCQPIGFIPTQNAERARAFYRDTLGLHLESEDAFALVFRLGPAPGIMLRVVCAGAKEPAPFTIFGWEVEAIETCVEELVARGIQMMRVDTVPQDERGIWTAPGGARIAWFKDPDGNVLSLSQHTGHRSQQA